MSDLIFNHSQVCGLHSPGERTDRTSTQQHEALLRTCELTLSTEPSDGVVEPCMLVFFSHHRPHLAERDLEFFTRAKASGWNCVKILTERYPVNLSYSEVNIDFARRLHVFCTANVP
jgi:nicotinamide N-methyltransferase